jgi:hypothetical protein
LRGVRFLAGPLDCWEPFGARPLREAEESGVSEQDRACARRRRKDTGGGWDIDYARDGFGAWNFMTDVSVP